MTEPRPGLGDDTGRTIKMTGGFLEYRYAPGLTCEIVNIEVEQESRRKGIGRAMVNKMLKEMEKAGHADFLYAITRAGNFIAQRFYEELRFKVVGVLREFYGDQGRTVDAIMFGRRLGSQA